MMRSDSSSSARARRVALCLGGLLLALGCGDKDGGADKPGPSSGGQEVSTGGAAGSGGQAMTDASMPISSGGIAGSGGVAGALPPRPRLPQSTAKLTGRVMTTDGEDLAYAVVRAGGLPVLTRPYGRFDVDDVHGADTATVRFQFDGYMPTQLALPIKADETQFVLAYMHPLSARVRAMLPSEEPIAFGDVATLALGQDSLRFPWGDAVSGAVELRFTDMRGDGRALRALPGDGTLADGRLLQVEAAFYVSAVQGAVELDVLGSAELRYRYTGLPLQDTTDAGAPAQGLTLYRFDAQTGYFEPRAEVTAQDGTVSLGLTQLGTYVLGTAIEETGCARVRLEGPDQTPLVGAAVRFSSAHHFGQALADSEGKTCVRGPAGVATASAFLVDGPRDLIIDDYPVSLSEPQAGGASCGLGCLPEVALPLQPRAIGCIKGRALGGVGEVDRLTVGAGAEQVHYRVTANEDFCHDVPSGNETSVMGASFLLSCLSEQTYTVSVGTCATNTCLDLDEVRCCGSYERCELEGYDDDCDGQVDEGCSCGGDACVRAASLSGCCTSDAKCGAKGVAAGSCFELNAPVAIDFNFACTDQTLSLGGVSTYRTGCCRPDGRCGLLENDFGCVAREDYQHLFDPTAILDPLPCGM